MDLLWVSGHPQALCFMANSADRLFIALDGIWPYDGIWPLVGIPMAVNNPLGLNVVKSGPVCLCFCVSCVSVCMCGCVIV